MSGKNYGWIEFIAMVPGLSRLIIPLMPDDSHARLNLDGPAAGPLFLYSYYASLKRTALVYSRIATLARDKQITADEYDHFRGK